MDNQNNQINSQFEMTEQEVKSYNFWYKVKYYLTAVEPFAASTLNTIIYWFIKFAKSTLKTVYRMILGKEV